MNLFHKVSASLYSFSIPSSTCLFTINTARNRCSDAFWVLQSASWYGRWRCRLSYIRVHCVACV